MCSAMVVLPDDSGPYISIILPRGMPPTPSAKSSSKQPEGIVDTDIFDAASPSLIMAPLPKSFSIWLNAISNAFAFSIAIVLCFLPFAVFFLQGNYNIYYYACTVPNYKMFLRRISSA